MKEKRTTAETLESLEKLAGTTSDSRPISAAMRREWDASRKAGRRMGRPPELPGLKLRIVPISLDPKLLAEIDKYTKAEGISRSRLIAEELRLRMKAVRGQLWSRPH